MYGNELSFEDKNSFRVLILKTRLQQAHINPNTSSTLLIYWVSSEVISRDGILGLWRGTSPTTIRNVPGIAVYLFGLAQLRTSMTTNLYSTSPIRSIQDSTFSDFNWRFHCWCPCLNFGQICLDAHHHSSQDPI
ncbi:hypothetical protein KEM48_004912 [Puccinia striiformis f. sp. tritici PST-130]|nr:hypothetical protein KEM48_004912 [Puccinia striiformis f. sp. tritici PST-130]